MNSSTKIVNCSNKDTEMTTLQMKSQAPVYLEETVYLEKSAHPEESAYRRVSKFIMAFGLLVGLLISLPAMALTVSEAKNAGLAGEQPNGYLGSVKSSPSAELQKLIKSTNHKRRSAYSNSAKKAGVSLDTMEKRIGQRLIQRAPAGQYFKTSSGHWQKK